MNVEEHWRATPRHLIRMALRLGSVRLRAARFGSWTPAIRRVKTFLHQTTVLEPVRYAVPVREQGSFGMNI